MTTCNNIDSKGRTCGSHALNDFPSTGLCDKCYWKTKAEDLTCRVQELENLLRETVKKTPDYVWATKRDIILKGKS